MVLLIGGSTASIPADGSMPDVCITPRPAPKVCTYAGAERPVVGTVVRGSDAGVVMAGGELDEAIDPEEAIAPGRSDGGGSVGSET